MPQNIRTVMIVSLMLFAAVYLMISNNLKSLLILSIIPTVILLMTKPNLIGMLCIVLYSSWIRAPLSPGERMLYEALMGIMFLSYCLRVMTNSVKTERNTTTTWVIVFLMTLIGLMLYRGFGFQSTGGSTWGGGRYLIVIPCALFFISAPGITLSTRQWRTAILMMGLFSFLPAIVEIVGIHNSSLRSTLNYFFTKPNVSAHNLETVSNLLNTKQRLTSFMPAASIYLLPFALLPTKLRYLPIFMFALIISALFAGLTGHRLLPLTMLLFIWLFFFLKTQRRISYIISSSFLCFATWAILSVSVVHLPLNTQRALSFIPKLNISQSVIDEARSTSEWRIQVWEEAIKDIPEYLIIGKGYSFNADAYISMMRSNFNPRTDSTLWATSSGSYHQGILSLLLGMGLIGLVSGLAVMFGIISTHHRLTKEDWADSEMKQIHFAVYIMFVTSSIIYIFVYGDVFTSFPSLFFYGALLEILRNTKTSENTHPLTAQE